MTLGVWRGVHVVLPSLFSNFPIISKEIMFVVLDLFLDEQSFQISFIHQCS